MFLDTTITRRELLRNAAAADGSISMQLHAGPPMKVRFKNIHIRQFP
jgi:hypothetical protein